MFYLESDLPETRTASKANTILKRAFEKLVFTRWLETCGFLDMRVERVPFCSFSDGAQPRSGFVSLARWLFLCMQVQVDTPQLTGSDL